ncbi:AMMECR1 domain-containing protein [Streptomyces ambofaciens]
MKVFVTLAMRNPSSVLRGCLTVRSLTPARPFHTPWVSRT